MKAPYFAAIALAITLPGRLSGQGLPFAVTIVDWEAATLDRQGRAYRSTTGDGEVLFCVEEWRTMSSGNGLERFIISRVRREAEGTRTRIADVANRCLATDGSRLPTIHTHSDGNCQFSPSDLIAIASRGAAFDGVQCGERHFIWGFAWQIVALGAAAERERTTKATRKAPSP